MIDIHSWLCKILFLSLKISFFVSLVKCHQSNFQLLLFFVEKLKVKATVKKLFDVRKIFERESDWDKYIRVTGVGISK